MEKVSNKIKTLSCRELNPLSSKKLLVINQVFFFLNKNVFLNIALKKTLQSKWDKYRTQNQCLKIFGLLLQMEQEYELQVPIVVRKHAH